MIEIELKTGGVTQVSDEDAAANRIDWFQNSRGYVVSHRDLIRLHRWVMERKLGRRLKPEEQVDHADNHSLNNQRENLRLATPAQNQANRGPNGDRRLKGVYPSGNKYVARISRHRKQHYLGTFETEEAAAMAWNRAALRLHGEFAYQNEVSQ